ncbi:MAG: class I SAM-dependent methyltransferase, partial [Cyanobacteria bacterium P01_F01_bin.3]
MSKSDPDQSSTTEAIREQFEFLPYPDIAIDQPFKGGRELLFRHNLTTPFYRKDQQLKLTEGSRILDAGCGTGYKALVLANANPGASIVGVDISEKSVSIAKQRLDHHGFGNTAFHVVPLEDIASIGQEFDYINCDETLYLLLNPQLGLEAMRSVLKPGGVLRVNFHSQFQRMDYFRAQQVGQLLGALTHTDQEAGIGLFRSAMQALK